MNAPHLHIIITHIPIVLLTLAIMLLGWSLFIKTNTSIKRLGLILVVVSALFTFGAYQSGEESEDIVEKISVVQHDAIEAHEEPAETASYILYVVGVLSLIALFGDIKDWPYARLITTTALFISVIGAGYLYYTAYLGGQIRHPEAYADQVQAVDSSSADQYQDGEDEDEGDDK